MIYKDQKQKQDIAKLNYFFERDNTPVFIRDFFIILNSGKSRLNYYNTIKSFLENTLTQIDKIDENSIIKLKYIDVIKYLDNLINSGYKSSSVKVKKDELSSFFRHLVSMEIIPKNIVEEIPKKKYKFRFIKNISKLPKDDTIEKFKSNILNIANLLSMNRSMIILEVFLGSGIRESELCGLNIDDVFLDEEYPFVRVLRKGNYNVEEFATTYIPIELANKISGWIKFRKEFFVGRTIDQEALFINKNGNRTNEDNVKKMFTKYGEGITPHITRSYYITNLMMETKDEAFVQEQVGHVIGSNITKDVYAIGSTDSRNILRGRI